MLRPVAVIEEEDDGTLVGLSAQDVRGINQLIGNVATQGVRSPISPRTEKVSLANQRSVVVVMDRGWEQFSGDNQTHGTRLLRKRFPSLPVSEQDPDNARCPRTTGLARDT
jgi:hypothetical protein